MAESMEDKRHAPTPLRRRRADQEGVFPRSQEWSVALTWITGIAILDFGGAHCFEVFSKLVANGLSTLKYQSDAQLDWYSRLGGVLYHAMLGGLPMLAGFFCVGLAMHFAQAGFRFRPDRLAWDFGRLSPKMVFPGGADAWVAVFGGILKLGLVVGVIGYGVWDGLPELVSWSQMPLGHTLKLGWKFLLGLGWWLGLGWLVLAGLDYAWEWWQHERRLRMTDNEIRQEQKESQPDGGFKSRRKKIALGSRHASDRASA